MQLSDNINELSEEAERLSNLINRIEVFPTNDFATRMNLISLKNLKIIVDERIKTLKFLESKADLEFTINGSPVVEHNVELSFFSSITMKLQELFSAVVQHLEGDTTEKGRLKGSISNLSSLKISAFQPSSFSIRINLPKTTEANTLFVHNQLAALHILKVFLNPQSPIEQIEKNVSSKRIKRKYKSLIESVIDNNAIVALKTKEEPIGLPFDMDSAVQVATIFKFKESENQKTIHGTLVGADIDKKTFHIKDIDNSYSGNIDEDIIDILLSINLGTEVDAIMKEISRTDGPTRYELLDINNKTE